ncbi:MAG: ATP-grasp domain-containing protein [Planctomycetales bacterium]|nr:ATP-grasp domain-containing protein [Planctomycetales bacterium]
MKVAVVSNLSHEGVINRFGQACPEKYSPGHVQMAVDAIRAAGYETAHIEADKQMLAELKRFMPPDPLTGEPTGMVFNMAYGIQGHDRYTHVPGMLELAGVPYTGSTPLGHAVALDKALTKIVIRDAGVPTPAFRVFRTSEDDAQGLRFPLVVKPLHESTSYGLALVHAVDELRQAVQQVVEQYSQPALVEEYVSGREFNIGLLGDKEVEVFPVLELDFGAREFALMTWGDKFHKRPDEPQKVCPARLTPEMTSRLQEIALACFRACKLRDYARVDLRLDVDGQPQVLEINSMASLGPGGSYMHAARSLGYTPQSMVLRILEIASARCPALCRQAAPA